MLHRIKLLLKKKGLIRIIWNVMTKIRRGQKVYEYILGKYGEKCKIYVGQHPGTGDVYIQAMFLQEIVSSSEEKYVFTVIGSAASKIAHIWGIKTIECLSLQQSNDLISYARFMTRIKRLNIDILHYHPMEYFYDAYLGYLRNYRGLNFFKMMSLAVFNHNGVYPSSLPKFEANIEKIRNLNKKYHLIPGKTVLLAPYANSLNMLPMEFWIKLAKKLNNLGYRVCTNSFGKDEPIIEGTCGLALEYNDLIAFLEQAGAVISLRSGLSDCISSAKCKKIILYPKQQLYEIMGGIGSSKDYFSLNNMKLCDDAIEYEIDFSNTKELKKVIKKIITYFQEPTEDSLAN